MLKSIQRVFLAVLAAVSVLVAPLAHATDTIDVTAAVSTITGTISPVNLVAGAVFSVFVIVKAWKWLRRAL